MKKWMQTIWGTLFTSQPKPGYRWVVWGWNGLLYLLGAAAWGKFLNWGNIPFDFQDWAEVNAARLAFVQDAIQQWVLPLHTVSIWSLRGGTDRFLVTPDVITSPQMLLLRFLDLGDFVVVDVILLYTIGWLGLLWLSRKYHLSPLTFGFLFLIFSFNGYIQSHLSVGHLTWLGYFLLPWLVGLLLEAVEEPQRWGWIVKVAFVEFFIVLQGSYHLYVWSLLFMGVMAVFAKGRFWLIFKAMVFSGLLSGVRLLPPVLGLGNFSTDFISGYSNLTDFMQALITLIGPNQGYSQRYLHNWLGWWEYDLYIGVVGAALVAYFGGFCWLRDLLKKRGQYLALLFPMIALTILSFGNVYRWFSATGIPLLSSERVSARMIILPFVVVAILATIHFQRWIDRIPPVFEIQMAGVLLLLAIGNDLWHHLNQWKVANAYSAFPSTAVDLTVNLVISRSDPVYESVLIIGASLTVLTAIFLVGMAWKEHRVRKQVDVHAQQKAEFTTEISD